MTVSRIRLEIGMLSAATIVSILLICSSLTAFSGDSRVMNQLELEPTSPAHESTEMSSRLLPHKLHSSETNLASPQKMQHQPHHVAPSGTQHQKTQVLPSELPHHKLHHTAPSGTQHQKLHLSPSELKHQPHHMAPSETLRYRQRCWHANYSTPDKAPVDHTPLPFLVGDSDTSGPSCRGEIFLLVMVHSAVPNHDRRELIRRTWASVSNIGGDRLTTIFFVGRSASPSESAALQAESDSRADIVQGDFVDTYRNLTYKHLHALRWIGERCQSVRYVMKVDDDVVLNVFHLRVALRERLASTKGDFFYCRVGSGGHPFRKPGSKWRVTKEEWAEDVYPDYCQGFGYVMTGSLIVPLHHCAKWRRFFWIDDVFVSGALASALGARRIRWEDGWNAIDMHPRLMGREAGQLVVVIAAGNWIAPSLHRRVWRAMIKYSGGLDDEI